MRWESLEYKWKWGWWAGGLVRWWAGEKVGWWASLVAFYLGLNDDENVGPLKRSLSASDETKTLISQINF